MNSFHVYSTNFCGCVYHYIVISKMFKNYIFGGVQEVSILTSSQDL